MEPFFLFPMLLIAGTLALLGGELFDNDDDETLFGTDEADLAILTNGADRFDGLAGGDSIIGNAGFDDIKAGLGDDTVEAGLGKDVILGNDGADRIEGGDWDDYILGGPGADFLFGENGKDQLVGGTGRDSLDGGGWDDTLSGGIGADTLVGGNGNDVIYGGMVQSRELSFDEAIAEFRNGTSPTDVTVKRDDGAGDSVDGGAGDDIIDVGNLDTVTGGNGQDVFNILNEAIQGTEATGGSITDYQAGQDTLVLLVPASDQVAAPTITFQDAAGDAQILSNGQVVATLTGVAASDLSPSSITVVQTQSV